ncbi:MAG TPA: hypothetical protein VFD63_00810, partial [Pyrinomonadaceae bacterium]|nr:hypothetical protein [Pyrinomonadaceae bacterium]
STPGNRESHIAAACGSFKSFLLPRYLPPEIANPTSRQRVDRSSPFYYHGIYPRRSRIPHRGSVWKFQVLSTTMASTPKIANPTSRQRVDRSSPFYYQAIYPETVNPTPRQRVDRSSPFYYHGIYSEDRESHIAAACGSFISFLHSPFKLLS